MNEITGIDNTGTLIGKEHAEYWAQSIQAEWRKQIDGILNVGRLLVEAKGSLEHGEWGKLTGETTGTPLLPFGPRTTQRLMEVSRQPLLSNPTHASDLPPSWMTLYELTKLEDLGERLEAGEITPDLERSTVIKWRREEKSRKDQRDAGIRSPNEIETCVTEDLDQLINRGFKFGCVYADPPWQYGNQGTRAATSNHYEGMTVEEIAALPIAGLLADNAHCHLWTTNGFLPDAFSILRAWGFDYKSCFVWVKPQMGIGNYWRVSHEFLLLGVKGSLPFREHNHMSWKQFDRRKHSAKPEEIIHTLTKVSPGPYLELFGRRIVPGWVTWGNQIERTMFDQAVATI